MVRARQKLTDPRQIFFGNVPNHGAIMASLSHYRAAWTVSFGVPPGDKLIAGESSAPAKKLFAANAKRLSAPGGTGTATPPRSPAPPSQHRSRARPPLM